MHLLIAIAAAAMAAQAGVADSSARQLDSLAGDWALHDRSGEVIGHSRIEVQVPGTMIFERRRVGEEPAQPLWFENAERNGGWTQLFVGPAGMTREFVLMSGAGAWPLVLGADVTLRDGTRAGFRMTMFRSSEDEFRRLLEMTRDGGASWTTVFDYGYRRMTSAAGQDMGRRPVSP